MTSMFTPEQEKMMKTTCVGATNPASEGMVFVITTSDKRQHEVFVPKGTGPKQLVVRDYILAAMRWNQYTSLDGKNDTKGYEPNQIIDWESKI